MRVVVVAGDRPSGGVGVTGAVVATVPAVAPATLAASRARCAELDRRGVPAALLVVPGPWRGVPLPRDPETVAWLQDRVAGGDEIVLHGWAHRAGPIGPRWRRGLVATGGTAEFAALPDPEAYGLLAAGLGVLDRLGLPVAGFAAPGERASPGTVRALSRVGLRYRLTRRAVHDLGSGGRVPLAGRGRPARTVRVDLDSPAALPALDAALAAGRTPLTYDRLLAAARRPAGVPA